MKFATVVRLIPSRKTIVLCHNCSEPMTSTNDKSKKIGCRWICRKQTNGVTCFAKINPLTNTIFQGVKLPIWDVLAIVFAFVRRYPVSFLTYDFTYGGVTELNPQSHQRLSRTFSREDMRITLLENSFDSAISNFFLCLTIMLSESSHPLQDVGGLLENSI